MMTHYRSVGDVPRKRHTVFTDASGRLLEELIGDEGFAGDSSLLYHRRSPSALVAVEEAEDDRTRLHPNHPVTPLHLRTPKLAPPRHADLVRGRQVLLGNDDVVLAHVSATDVSPLYRSVVGDELVFVHGGHATLRSVFGVLDVAAGDYVVVPAGTTHQWVPDGPVECLVLEASSHVRPPRRYLTATGQFLEHAPYCERDLRAPAAPLVETDTGESEVLVRTRAGLARHVHTTHPFDVVGWAGCVYPHALSIHDFEPIVGSLHQPPHVHQTFELDGAVVCSFVPRPFDFHPDAVKVPYHHANVDSDEVIFYADGDFMSRAGSGIGRGSISVHPAGFVHGPQPGSWERSRDADRTAELAVMVDTFRPLLVSDTARAIADPDYVRSWLGGG
jgi:homogentisate 1,2-dioxygenase